ncbi:MAG: hypothetical protein CMC19_00645 [Flavobacteriaceae bacterium]|nr:hypothetical protein [Flavobacteriaceae bacterium]OUX40502.1 MAG: hypothetical protein CBE25_00040 [Flavobacteriaceae bacterium TMED265]
MKKISLLITALTTAFFGFGQQLSMDLAGDLKPRNLGPAGMSGRVTTIDVQLSNTDIMYVGTASGGLWQSKSAGIKWEPIFDNELTASIGAVKIDPNNPDVIWVGTGEGNPRNSLNGGYGIYKSIDGGKSWTSMGLENTRHIHRILIDPSDSNTVYVGAIGSPWGTHPERGVFKTTDGGKSWRKVLFTNEQSGIADMVMDPVNPNKIIAAMWEHKRDPWFFKSGGSGSGIYMTYDGGENWKKLDDSNGLPKGELGRIGLAIAKNKPEIMYALVESKKNALYKSEDGGENWKKINDKSDIGNRPFYYSEIYVDPQNENRVFSIFTYVNVSEDGGKNFSELMPAYGVDNGVHPDHHAWWIHPEDGSFMMDGNDGGLNITRDGGKTWHFIDNLPVGQFYHISADNEYPYNVYGGMQDNGSWRGPAYVWRAQSIRNSYWQEIAFGDGFDVVPDRDDSRYGYAMSQQGNVLRYDWMTGNNYGVRPTPEDPNTKLRFNWNAAIGQDPFDNSTVYFGSQFVHKSDDKGTTWKIISPDLTTNDPEKQKQSESGGLTMDATGAENHCTILVIEPSVVEPNMLWVGTDDGRVHFTRDGGMNWDDVSKNLKGLPKGSWIAQIKASKNNPGEAFLVANNYRRFDYTPYVYRTKNYGKSWSRIVDEGDVQSYALSIIEDNQNPNLIFLGTDDGLYLSLNAGENWQKYTNGFPTVSTKDLAIHQREQDLLIGTFGRALWVMDDIRPLRAIAADPEILNKDFYLFDPPTGYQVAYQQPTGSRFGGDAMYGGENKKSGAMISYFVGKGSEDLKEKDSISFEFFDEDRLMRTIKMPRPKKAGIHRWYWRMDEKGVQRPRRSLRKSKVEPSGVRVLPGTYTIKGALGENSNETVINVAFDPRLTYDEGTLRSVYNAQKELESLTARSAEAVRQLLESKQSVSALSKQFQENDKEGFKEAIKQSKEITKEIDKLVAIFLGSIDKRQGITRNPEITVSSRISGAYRYVASRKTAISETETRLMQLAKDDLNKALKKVNSFYEEQWGNYQKEMENIKLDYFKEVKSFDIEN